MAWFVNSYLSLWIKPGGSRGSRTPGLFSSCCNCRKLQEKLSFLPHVLPLFGEEEYSVEKIWTTSAFISAAWSSCPVSFMSWEGLFMSIHATSTFLVAASMGLFWTRVKKISLHVFFGQYHSCPRRNRFWSDLSTVIRLFRNPSGKLQFWNVDPVMLKGWNVLSTRKYLSSIFPLVWPPLKEVKIQSFPPCTSYDIGWIESPQDSEKAEFLLFDQGRRFRFIGKWRERGFFDFFRTYPY